MDVSKDLFADSLPFWGLVEDFEEFVASHENWSLLTTVVLFEHPMLAASSKDFWESFAARGGFVYAAQKFASALSSVSHEAPVVPVGFHVSNVANGSDGSRVSVAFLFASSKPLNGLVVVSGLPEVVSRASGFPLKGSGPFLLKVDDVALTVGEVSASLVADAVAVKNVEAFNAASFSGFSRMWGSFAHVWLHEALFLWDVRSLNVSVNFDEFWLFCSAASPVMLFQDLEKYTRKGSHAVWSVSNRFRVNEYATCLNRPSADLSSFCNDLRLVSSVLFTQSNVDTVDAAGFIDMVCVVGEFDSDVVKNVMFVPDVKVVASC